MRAPADSFPVAARRELANVQLRSNLRNATDTIRDKRARVVRGDPRSDGAREEVADFRAVAVDRGHENVRRPVAVELEDQLGEVRLERVDALFGERVVQLELVCRE